MESIIGAVVQSNATIADSSDDFMDIFFELDFRLDSSDNLSTTTDNTTCTTDLEHIKVEPELTSTVKSTVKASKSRVGAKCKISGSRRSIQASKLTVQNSSDDLNQRLSKTNVPTLYAFPSFDKSDALIYLPTTMSRHLNSGDIKELGKLLTSHLDKSCFIEMSFFDHGQLNVKHLIKLYEIMSDMHPDMISCATNITVNENKIRATIHAKFTDIKAIHDSVRARVTEPLFVPLLKKDRVEGMKEELEKDGRPQEEIDHYLALVATGEDLLVYINLSLEMTVDDLTKKVSEFSLRGRVTSMTPANYSGSRGIL